MSSSRVVIRQQFLRDSWPPSFERAALLVKHNPRERDHQDLITKYMGMKGSVAVRSRIDRKTTVPVRFIVSPSRGTPFPRSNLFLWSGGLFGAPPPTRLELGVTCQEGTLVESRTHHIIRTLLHPFPTLNLAGTLGFRCSPWATSPHGKFPSCAC